MSNFLFGYVSDPKDGPIDGVSMETVGVYTKFRGKGLFQADKHIIRQEKTNVGIKVAVSTGVLSIHDRKRDQAIAVPIAELAAILEEAMKTNEKLRNENGLESDDCTVGIIFCSEMAGNRHVIARR